MREFLILLRMKDPELLLHFGSVILMIIIANYDFRYQRIPDRMIQGMFLWSLLYLLFPVMPDQMKLTDRMSGAALLFLIPAVICLIRPGAFGGGDIKLLAVCGLILGPGKGLVGFCVSILLSGLVCMFELVFGKRRYSDRISFGPYICAGMILSMFWGEKLIGWYL